MVFLLLCAWLSEVIIRKSVLLCEQTKLQLTMIASTLALSGAMSTFIITQYRWECKVYTSHIQYVIQVLVCDIVCVILVCVMRRALEVHTKCHVSDTFVKLLFLYHVCLRWSQLITSHS